VRCKQALCEVEPLSPVRRMVPGVAMLGGFLQRARELVGNAWAARTADTDLNDLADDISDQIWEVYEDHYAEVKRTRHRQLKKMQQAADKSDGLELLRECGRGAGAAGCNS
jgi:hypothetical protein